MALATAAITTASATYRYRQARIRAGSGTILAQVVPAGFEDCQPLPASQWDWIYADGPNAGKAVDMAKGEILSFGEGWFQESTPGTFKGVFVRPVHTDVCAFGIPGITYVDWLAVLFAAAAGFLGVALILWAMRVLAPVKSGEPRSSL